MATGHAGSWFGLPDFGITEALTSRRTDQGGSQLIGTPAPQQQALTGQVLGNTVSAGTPVNFPQPASYYTPPSTGGSTGGSSGGSSAPAPTNPGFNWATDRMNRDKNPGSGYFWDAADGWKQIGTGGGASAEADAWRNNINSGFNEYENRLGGLVPMYEGQQGSALESAQNIYNQIVRGLDQTKQAALDKLNLNRQQVGTRMANSITDLQNNLRNTTRNMAMQLGAMGAGDTSASNVMLPYAYTKLAGTEYGKIQRQGNDQYFQIDTQEKDTTDQYNQLVNQSNLEKENQMQNIRNQYGQMIAQIRSQMASVPVERANALAALNSQLLTEAQNRLNQIEANAMQQQTAMQQWATQRLAQLNDYKLQLNQSSNFSPQDIMWNELQGGQVGSYGGGASDAYWNPAMAAQKKKQLGY